MLSFLFKINKAAPQPMAATPKIDVVIHFVSFILLKSSPSFCKSLIKVTMSADDNEFDRKA